MTSLRRFGLAFAALVLPPLLCGAGPGDDEIKVAESDWPWWRGPQRNGVAPDGQNPPTSWSSTENVAWKADVPGRGHGSPTVSDDRVNQAIDRGVAYLRAKGPRPAVDRRGDLVTLALLHAELKPDDSFLSSCRGATLQRPPKYVYNVAMQAMLLWALDDRQYQGRIARLAQFLVDSQRRNGQWAYVGKRVTPVGNIGGAGLGLGGPVKNRVLLGGDAEGRKLRPLPRVTLTAPPAGALSNLRGDTSNTHFAAMGLWIAERSNVDVPKATWDRLIRYLHKSQNSDGGWGYDDGSKQAARVANKGRKPAATKKHDPDKSSGAMTAGAAICLVAARHFQGRPWKSDARLQKGIRWLKGRFKPGSNSSGDPRWHYYHLYTLMHLGEAIGNNDWRRRMTGWLLDRQREDGGWKTPNQPQMDAVNTCFAILILRRAAPELREPQRRPVAEKPAAEEKPRPVVSTGEEKK